MALTPGINRVLIQAFGLNGNEIARTTSDIWSDSHTPTTVSANVTADTTWTAANGPHLVSAAIAINSGSDPADRSRHYCLPRSGSVSDREWAIARGRNGNERDYVHATARNRHYLGRHHCQRRRRLTRNSNRLCLFRFQRLHCNSFCRRNVIPRSSHVWEHCRAVLLAGPLLLRCPELCISQRHRSV